MSGNDAGTFRFRCPGCEESLTVNRSMRRILLRRGCVLCGAPLTAGAFTRTSACSPR